MQCSEFEPLIHSLLNCMFYKIKFPNINIFIVVKNKKCHIWKVKLSKFSYLQITMLLFLSVSFLHQQSHLHSFPLHRLSESLSGSDLWFNIFSWLLEILVWTFHKYLRFSTSRNEFFFPSKHALLPMFSS